MSRKTCRSFRSCADAAEATSANANIKVTAFFNMTDCSFGTVQGVLAVVATATAMATVCNGKPDSHHLVTGIRGDRFCRRLRTKIDEIRPKNAGNTNETCVAFPASTKGSGAEGPPAPVSSWRENAIKVWR